LKENVKNDKPEHEKNDSRPCPHSGRETKLSWTWIDLIQTEAEAQVNVSLPITSCRRGSAFSAPCWLGYLKATSDCLAASSTRQSKCNRSTLILGVAPNIIGARCEPSELTRRAEPNNLFDIAKNRWSVIDVLGRPLRRPTPAIAVY
jgi:hypothetical protein